MNLNFQKYTYNFNPRDGPKQMKLRYLKKTGVMMRSDIPIGSILEHKRYQTACRTAYIQYHQCLQKNRFNRQICRRFEQNVIECEKKKNLYQKNEDIIERLRQGFKISQIRKQQINEKLRKNYETKVYSKNTKTTFTQQQKKELKQKQFLQSIPQLVETEATFVQQVDD